MKKTGVLLLNLGTPNSPEPKDVGLYLEEFLMDKYVVDISFLLRWLLVKVLIVPKRKFASSALYKTIWTNHGSPLLFHLKDLRNSVAAELEGSEFDIDIAMRYGEPSITAALERFKAKDLKELIVLPLYPQFADSSTLSSREACLSIAKHIGFNFPIRFIPAFYDEPSFIGFFAKSVRAVFERQAPEHLVMSFHGLPERHVRSTDRSTKQTHCLKESSCCETLCESNRDCYRAQSFQTAKLIAQAAGLKQSDYTVSFQSRLGATAWIKPYTDLVFPELARRGIKKIAVICPSFVADCLETIEEIGVRGVECFEAAGGVELIRIDCPNSDSEWAHGVAQMIRKASTAGPSRERSLPR